MPNGETTLTDENIRALPFMLTTRHAADVCGIGRRTPYDHVEHGTYPPMWSGASTGSTSRRFSSTRAYSGSWTWTPSTAWRTWGAGRTPTLAVRGTRGVRNVSAGTGRGRAERDGKVEGRLTPPRAREIVSCQTDRISSEGRLVGGN